MYGAFAAVHVRGLRWDVIHIRSGATVFGGTSRPEAYRLAELAHDACVRHWSVGAFCQRAGFYLPCFEEWELFEDLVDSCVDAHLRM